MSNGSALRGHLSSGELVSSDADLSLLNIPGYKSIHQGSRCTRRRRKLYTYTTNIHMTFEVFTPGLIFGRDYSLVAQVTSIFVDLIQSGWFIDHRITIITPIQTFIEAISLIINTLQKEVIYAAIVRDVNINLLRNNKNRKLTSYFIWCALITFLQKYVPED